MEHTRTRTVVYTSSCETCN